MSDGDPNARETAIDDLRDNVCTESMERSPENWMFPEHPFVLVCSSPQSPEYSEASGLHFQVVNDSRNLLV